MKTEAHPPKSNPRILEKSKIKHTNIKPTNIATIFDKRFVNYQSTRSTASSLGSAKSARTTLKSKLLKKIQESLISPSIPESKTEEERHVVPLKVSQRLNEDDVLSAINSIKKNMDKRKSFRFDKKGSELLSPMKSRFSLDQESMSSHVEKKNISIHLFEFQYNDSTNKKANILRYRENVFRAASRLTRDIPAFPDWTYQDEDIQFLDVTKINVGGQIFQVFDDTLSSLAHTKLSKCLSSHRSDGIPFFDRDYVCFSAILNFYRTGRLHIPPNTCLSLFEEELEFWGVSEQFIEPCCWSEYESVKIASVTLRKHADNMHRYEDFSNFNETGLLNLRIKLYNIMNRGSGSILARWISSVYAIFILLNVFGMVLSTTDFGRVNVNDSGYAIYSKSETVSNFLTRTRTRVEIKISELVFSGFFLAELLIRFILCPSRLEFCSDTLNWIDLLGTTTSILSNLITHPTSSGRYEGYMLILKLPRIFRLFKVTTSLRCGMEAFTFTIRASSQELSLIFLLLFVMSGVFGSLIFVVEMVNEDTVHYAKSAIKNINIGVWWALGTMTTLGYGDYLPRTHNGHLLGAFTIMLGVIICALPVPIVLKNFDIYHNQSLARLDGKQKPYVRMLDPEAKTTDCAEPRSNTNRPKRTTKFKNFFNALK